MCNQCIGIRVLGLFREGLEQCSASEDFLIVSNCVEEPGTHWVQFEETDLVVSAAIYREVGRDFTWRVGPKID